MDVNNQHFSKLTVESIFPFFMLLPFKAFRPIPFHLSHHQYHLNRHLLYFFHNSLPSCPDPISIIIILHFLFIFLIDLLNYSFHHYRYHLMHQNHHHFHNFPNFLVMTHLIQEQIHFLHIFKYRHLTLLLCHSNPNFQLIQ